MEYKLSCYEKASCCNCDCDYLYLGNQNEPCWGVVEVIAEEHKKDDYWWIHLCEGHLECYEGGIYVRKNTK